MSGRYFGFLLLVLLPAKLHAQTAARPCRAPKLVEGYFVPVQEMYSHEAKITYACDKGRKPAVEGWWATSTCHNGAWLHTPQCIDTNACIPPTILNGKYTETSDGWYNNEDIIRITCDKGYKHKDYAATAKCLNGTWSSLPVCEVSEDACGQPPKVPHAVIINQEHQELFAVDSQVLYECESGYTIDGSRSKKSVFCLSGTWSQAPVCSRQTGTGHGGSGSTEVTGRETGTGHGGSGSTEVTGTSGSNGGNIHTAPINSCGNRPVVQNGDVVESGAMFLRYRCSRFYTQVGPETVVCYSDGTWSEVPSCRPAYCSVDTDQYPNLESDGVKYIKDGERVELACVPLDHWLTDHYSVVHCTNRKVTLTKCCSWIRITMKLC